MNILLRQKSKDLFSGDFEILKNNQIIGNVYFNGKLGSMEANIKGTMHNKTFMLTYNKLGFNKKFRTYNINVNNIDVGEIFQTEFKKNIFSKYDYIKLIYNNIEYDLYSIELGTEGVNVLYNKDKQIAQINKNGIIYNDLHHFDIYSIDEDSCFLSVLISCYMYITTCYKAGIKVTKSVTKNYGKTTNKFLISKYNPEWINKVKE